MQGRSRQNDQNCDAKSVLQDFLRFCGRMSHVRGEINDERFVAEELMHELRHQRRQMLAMHEM